MDARARQRAGYMLTKGQVQQATSLLPGIGIKHPFQAVDNKVDTHG